MKIKSLAEVIVIMLTSIFNSYSQVKSNIISTSESLIIEALDGKTTITDANEVFKSYLDPDFKEWYLDKPSESTNETLVQVFEVNANSAINQMFTSINSNLDQLCLTQAQIVRFCEKYHARLIQEKNYTTFFLFKMHGEYFVAIVNVDLDELNIHASHFEDGYAYLYVRSTKCRHNLVIPMKQKEETNEDKFFGTVKLLGYDFAAGGGDMRLNFWLNEYESKIFYIEAEKAGDSINSIKDGVKIKLNCNYSSKSPYYGEV